MNSSASALFEATTLGPLQLANRIVMAPMTRSRARDNVPNELMATYYGQRAGAGLILTEGTAPSPNALGYPRIPGLFTDGQQEGWRRVVSAVHAKGGKIFVQLMHTGRVTHPANLPEGGEVLAPSAVSLEETEMWVDPDGPEPIPTARAMTEAEIEQAIEEFVASSRRARAAGFDGVELHGANGYLIDQFISPHTNRRDDAWGGSRENRLRFPLELARRVADAIGPDRVGMRVSPYGVFNEMTQFDDTDATFTALAEGLGNVGLVYLHLVDHGAMGAPPVPGTMRKALRAAFPGTFILSGGYDAERAAADLTADRGDLVAFGRPFLANPDLPERMRRGATLNEPREDLFYSPGAEGYTDYPTLD